MTGHENHSTLVDGRVARRQRNIECVLDVVVEMFTEGELFPSVESVAKRSGLSVRSIYRYFADPAELSDAAIKRHRQMSMAYAHIPRIGQGPLAPRIDNLVATRLRLYEAVGAAYRAAVHNAPVHPRLRDELARNRNDLRIQLERHFAPELARLKGVERDSVVAAADVLTQLDAIDLLRRYRQFSIIEASEALTVGLARILGQ